MSAETESQLNPKQQLIAAIFESSQTGEIESLVNALRLCNTFLTGLNQGDFTEGERFDIELRRKVSQTINEFRKSGRANCEAINLGDGGYSRLLFAIRANEILVDVSSNSSEKVKSAWYSLGN